MLRVALFASFVAFTPLSLTWAQQAQTIPAPLTGLPSGVTTRSPLIQPAPSASPVQIAPAGPYYPPPDALQGPLTPADVCCSLRGGLSEGEVAQDVRERGMVGAFDKDEAADARAAGASANLITALQAGRFTVSDAYARRYAEASNKRQKGADMNAWRAQNATNAQIYEREKESKRQGQLADTVNRAALAKETEDQRRFEHMKDKAASEQRQRDAYNADNGYWLNGTWYPPYRSSSRRR